MESDPNILYGGDTEGTINEGCATLGELILSDLKKGEDRVLYVNGITDQSSKYNEVREQSIILAKSLFSAGIREKDVVGIISENRLEFPVIAFAAIYLGAIITPINITYTEREILHAVELSKPKFIFVSKYGEKKTIAIAKRTKFVKKVILLDGKGDNTFTVSIQDFISNARNDTFNIEEHVCQSIDIYKQVALIVYSSGTTGLPKGVQITQANMLDCLSGYREMYQIIRLVYEESLVNLNVAPWFHALGFMSMYMTACSHEGKYIFLPKFDEVAFLRSIEKYKVNVATVVPPIMVFLAKSPLFDQYDLSTIKEIGCGAAVLTKQIEQQVKKRFKDQVQIRQGYGMSETTLGVLTSVMIKSGSVGSPVKGVYVKVIDENGNTLGPNQPGELCFKGKRIMLGYINDPSATKDTVHSDGWLHSGDIGYYDEDVQFFIVDRLKELIKYKALQVAPAEVEGILFSHPMIKDAGVIGIPDEACGELPFGFVVKQPGAKLTEQEVIKYVEENSSKAKRLHGGVRFIDEIPKNPSGKILRRVLRDMYSKSNIKSKL